MKTQISLLTAMCMLGLANAQTPPIPAAPAITPPAAPANISIPLSVQPTSATAPATPTAEKPVDPANAGPGSMFDNRLPAMDPATGMIKFNGQTWDPVNNKFFAARFEKFLNTPEELGQLEQEHRAILNRIITLLDPSNVNSQTVTDAFKLLNRAAVYPGDSRLCDTLTQAIYSVWQTKKNQQLMAQANNIMEKERETARRNIATIAASRRVGSNAVAATLGILTNPPNPTSPAPKPKENEKENTKETQAREFAGALEMTKGIETLSTNAAAIKVNNVKSELSELQAKLEFQGLLLQLFLQRRFHHLVIGTRFYRVVFNDGDSKLNLPEKSTQILGNGGAPPTISTLEALANEAMRDVKTSVQAFHSSLEKGSLDSATKRLTEAFLVGEFMPEVRTLPQERKLRILSYAEKGNQLLAAIETKDYTLASELLNGPTGLKAQAKDFDGTKPNALIETSRNMARLHLAKAKNAAISGDKPGFEAALAEAGKIWPNNPELLEIAAKAFSQSDVQNQALIELDQLIAQKNFRKIAEDAGRFLAATHLAPQEKQSQLKSILEDCKIMEAALMGAKEMDRQGNPAGAWEAIEKVNQKFPEDLQLAQAKALYTTQASDFVRTVQNGQDHEKRAQAATSLAWYLKAQKLYPKSDIAEEAINRLKVQVMPK
jgi:hypothetical protein